jgi:hypothetical protein
MVQSVSKTRFDNYYFRPVIIEVPHFASLRGKQREIVVLRSDNGETWKEHTLEANEEAIQDVLNHSFDGEGFLYYIFLVRRFYCLLIIFRVESN